MACCPGVSLSLYCSIFCAVMVNSGCSPAKGSAIKPRSSTLAAVVDRPPVHSGMVPAALPAFSAPIGVRVVPSWLISDWDRLCAATALATRLRARPQAPMNVFCICILFSPKTGLEAYAEADSGEVAVNQGVVLAIKEVGVTDAGVVLVGVVGIQTDADRLGVLDEVRAVALNVVRPGDIRAQVDTGNHVAVVQGRTQTVTPGEVGEVAIVFTPAVAVGVGCVLRVTGAVGALTLTKQGVTTKLGHTATSLHATDVVGTNLTDQGETACAEHPVNEVHCTHGRLPELLALIALQVSTGGSSLITAPARIPRSCQLGNSRTAQVTSVDLDGHIRTITELTRHGHTANVSTKADTIQTDIFGILEEIASSTFGTIKTRHCLLTQQANTTLDVGVHRPTAVVVHCIEAELGVIQRRNEPAERHTELTAVTGILVLAGTNNVAWLPNHRRRQTRVTWR